MCDDQGVTSRNGLTLLVLITALAVGAAVGVATAPRGAPEAAKGLVPLANFTPGYVVVPPGLPTPSTDPLPTLTPGPEPTAISGSLPVERLPLVRFTGGNSVVLPIEVPATSEYGIGFSGRRAIAGRGMLFYYPDGKATTGFWMKNTHVDLDIAFVDTSMMIIAIMQMQADTETVHRPSAPYTAAIEAPKGYFQAVGIGVGARVEFLFDIAAFLKQ
ncbi:MAG: DUF192 domain-containing protein [Chloroflexi bacterium]|nr:MAG: DUF192 domain-containing protein [Chloroflexota bacterium]